MVTGTALIGCIAMSFGIQGWYFSGQKKVNWVIRLLVLAAGFCMMIPNDLLSVVGLVVLVGLFVLTKMQKKKTQPA